MSDDDICGHPTADGSPCQHTTTEDGDSDRCWVPSHNGNSDDFGRTKVLDDPERRQMIFDAAEAGLHVGHQAAAAGVSRKTLQRYACCIDDLSEPILDPDGCDFCRSYATAHANGAREVLEDCSSEFRASASFGYTRTEKKELEHSGEVDGFEFTINKNSD